MESLWEAIFCAVRIQDGDAVQAWREHDALLSEKCEILNKYQFAELHYENEAGTDFRVGLVKTISGKAVPRNPDRECVLLRICRQKKYLQCRITEKQKERS